jgi:hypothetical protein
VRQARATEDGDLFPGLLAMSQSWLEDVAVSSFRAVPGATASLDAWFSDPRVALYHKVQCLPCALLCLDHLPC